MGNIVDRFLITTFDIDFKMLERLQDGTITTQYDRIIIPIEGGGNINLSTIVMEIELMFDISRNNAFWCMHKWLMSKTHNHVWNGGDEQAMVNLKYLLGWFTQMV